ncbi:hypothetical protein HOLleu_26415 [Holothuria leucospilota]|uniref:Reverse transcriptase domain-containing protein n=1 Tax=Holothuria leucospilota TaxID=206669 RepID=A0A9Q1BNY9_HOLLE|nr:hypothetical protein HOLleu_26415 [Holothuria leucospilota]
MTYSLNLELSLLLIQQGTRPCTNERERVHKELKRMEALGIIVMEERTSQWVSSMVTVTKSESDRVRICLDPKDLNNMIERQHYPMKTIGEVTLRLPNAKLFSTLDANCRFWQLELDAESSELCTFNSPFGRYRYTRLPFGISSAPEIFQRTMSQVFEDIEVVEVIMNDILAWGNKEQHDKSLTMVLKRA